MTAPSSGPSAGYSTGEVIRFVVAALLLVGLIVFCVANTGDVRLHYLFGTAHLPLIGVMAGSGVAGILIAALVRRSRR